MSLERPEAGPVAPAAPSSVRVDGAGIAVLLGAAAYMLTWWNRYLAPTIGFELMFADQYARGCLPYRDYYFPVQPGWVLGSILGVKLFGPRLAVFWALGMLVRLASVWLTYRLLRRLCSPPWAAGATFVAFVASCGDVADFPAWYNHMATSFAIAAAFGAVRSVEAEGPGRWPWIVLTGFALALEFLTKQTVGILVGLAGGTALFAALCWRHGPRRAIADLLAIVAFASAPCLLVAGWLAANGAWSAYVDQVYVKGPSSKGGLGGSLLRILKVAVGTRDLRAAGFLAAWIAAGAAWLRRGAARPMHPALAIVPLTLMIAALSYYDTRSLPLAACVLGLVGSLAVALVAFASALRGERGAPTMALGIIGGIAFASNFALSLSWPLFEPMTWPGLALVFAAVWYWTPAPAPRRRLQALALVIGAMLVGTSAWRKYREPMSWGYWVEPPVSEATQTPAVPQLRGFRLSPSTCRFYERVTALIHQHSRPDEPILVFPHMPLLYGLGERPLATFAYMHYPDVCPDYVAEADAERIVRRPPAVIIRLDFPEAMWTEIEKDFRKNQQTGQRKLRDAMNDLIARAYDKVGEFPVGEFADADGKPLLSLRVWALRK